MSANVKLIGDKVLERRLHAMGGPKMQRAITRKGLRKGASLLIKRTKAHTPKGPTGNLRKLWRQKRTTHDGQPAVWVHNTAPHAHLVEFGTAPRSWTVQQKHVSAAESKGNVRLSKFYRSMLGKTLHTGQMPPHPFFRSTLIVAGDGVHEAILQEVEAEIDRILGIA